MNRLDELIQELCPDGVLYQSVDKLIKCNIIKTITPSIKIKRSDYREMGRTPIISQEMELISGYCEIEDKNIPANNYVCFGDHSEQMKYVDFSFVQGADGLKIMCMDENVLNSRYFYYSVLNYYTKHNNYERHFKYLLDTIIPVPPLRVQKEIVRILDDFTGKIFELQEHLNEELQARKRQYEYYRNRLMDIGLDFTKMPLKDIVSTFRGEYITKKSAKQGSIPVILGGQEPAYYIDRANHEGEIVVVARSGVSAGFVSYWDEPIFVTDGFGYEAKKSVVIPKYLYYILKNREKEMKGMKRGAGVPHVSGEALLKLEFSIPPLEVQEQIVLVNERLDNEYNELFVTLEAEIELCQKQYEYYRDKLLTFKEKTC